MMKKKVREIMSPPVVAVAPETLLSEAVGLMREKGISCLPVLSEGKPVGIFTERNMVRHIARHGIHLTERPIAQVMTTPVLTASPDIYLYEAFHILDSNKIRHLVVIDGQGKAVGVVTLSSIIEQMGSENMVEFQPVERIMSRVVFTVSEDVPVRDILIEMAERSISCIVYVDSADSVPRGILTERDVVRLATGNGDLESKNITEVMSGPVVTVPKSSQVHDVARSMRESGIRRVVVVDQKGRVAGLVTQSDIVRGLETRYIKVLRQVIDEKDSKIKVTARERDEISLYLDSILNTAIDMGIVATDTDFRVIYYNHCAEQLLDFRAEDAIGRDVREIHEKEGEEFEHFSRIVEKVKNDTHYTFSYDRTVDSQVRHYQGRIAAIWDVGKNLVGYVHVLQDITERKKAEENIRFMAYHDILTGLPNRVALDERLELELARAERNGHMLAVTLLDLDRFKQVNDTLGHYVGDLFLKGVADRIRVTVRKSDTVARIGGDEFVLVLPEIKSSQDAVAVTDKLIKALSFPVEVNGEEIETGISAGIACFPAHAKTGKRLMELADEAMYVAKERGRKNNRSNCHVVED